jgi:1,4-alpha-glucan branching enzyme
MKTGTMVEYARKRTQGHVARFTHLYRALTGEEALREEFLHEFEDRDNIFPEIDYRVYR